MKKLLGIIFFTLLVCIATAQSGVDSLEKKLAASKADTNRVLILSQLVVLHVNSHHAMAMNYAQQGIALARTLKFRRSH